MSAAYDTAARRATLLTLAAAAGGMALVLLLAVPDGDGARWWAGMALTKGGALLLWLASRRLWMEGERREERERREARGDMRAQDIKKTERDGDTTESGDRA